MLDGVRGFYNQKKNDEPNFGAGQSAVHYHGRGYGEELVQGVDSVMDFRLMLGRNGSNFEENLWKFLGFKQVLLANSVLPANLIAVSALTSYKLERQLKPGDEVITLVLTFACTFAPIVQNGFIPVFVDVET